MGDAMIGAMGFKARSQTRVRFSKGLDLFSIPADAKRFLKDTGLPRLAGPFEFHCEGAVKTVAATFGLKPEALDADAIRLIALPVIGTDEDGDPICIDRKGRIVIVDHESGFTEAVVVNSSLSKLLVSIPVFTAYEAATSRLPDLPDSLDAWKQALKTAASSLRSADPKGYPGYWHGTLCLALDPLASDMKHMKVGWMLAGIIDPSG